MKKIILLFVLTAAILSFKTKSSHHKAQRIRGDDKIFKTAAQIELLKQSNKEADAKYALDVDGTDKVDEPSYLGYDLYLAKKLTSGDDKTLNFRSFLFRVNKYALYYGDPSVKSQFLSLDRIQRNYGISSTRRYYRRTR